MKLDEEGDSSKDDRMARYALWKIAADGACVASEFSKAMEIVNKIQSQFDVDGEAMKADLLNTSATRSTIGPEAAHDLCDTALKLAAAAIVRDDLDMAAQFAKLATTAVRRAKDPSLNRDVLERSREIEHLKGRFALVAKAMETLSSDADNAEANRAVGEWDCFVKGDWENGLPYLAKGSRKDLAALANRELAKPAAAKDQVAVADAWWALAEKERTDSKRMYHARAVHWYEQALPNLSGLEATRVEKQILLARSAPAPEVRGRGAVQRGNVALASNGTTVAGVEQNAERLLNGIPDQKDSAQSKFPCVFTITFDKVYMLRQIRFHLYETDSSATDHSNASYRVLVSRDKKKL